MGLVRGVQDGKRRLEGLERVRVHGDDRRLTRELGGERRGEEGEQLERLARLERVARELGACRIGYAYQYRVHGA